MVLDANPSADPVAKASELEDLFTFLGGFSRT